MTDDDIHVPDFPPEDDNADCPDDDHIHCFVAGCPYTCPLTARDEFEQHFRWLHLPKRDFGPDPIPTLTALMVNGIIRPDEFGELTTQVINDSMPTPPRRLRWFWAACLVAAPAALIYNFYASWDTKLDGKIAVMIILSNFVIGLLYGFFLAHLDGLYVITRSSTSRVAMLQPDDYQEGT